MANETIFALSTGLGKAGIAIIRVSGCNALYIARKLTSISLIPRVATVCYLRFNQQLIDQALVVFFKAGSSYTGEDLVEFHIHGGAAVISHLSNVLSTEFDASVANPGDFTRRALENGRLDISQVEGLLDLINAETIEQKKQSLRIFSGQIAQKSKQWREKILHSLSLAEIMIDFSDEDVPSSTVHEIEALVSSLVVELEFEIAASRSAALVRDGFDVTIVGQPNVGKSSLLNYLAGKEKAIVSEQAGTTRDIIELSIDLKGFRVNFYDTAGIHFTENTIEKIGIERALQKAATSHMRVFLLNPSDMVEDFNVVIEPTDLILGAKCDLQKHKEYSGISSTTGDGVSDMLTKISNTIIKSNSYSSILVNERHKSIIERTLVFLSLVLKEINLTELRIEIVAENLRLAIVELDFLVGKINVEDVLGDIFSSFCIGK
jgi:tRNA modification GTPase